MAGGMEVDGKSSDGKEKSSIKRSKGSLGSLNMITGKSNNELGKTSGASANGVSQRYTYAQILVHSCSLVNHANYFLILILRKYNFSSGESGSEGSSEGSDANSQNVSYLLVSHAAV